MLSKAASLMKPLITPHHTSSHLSSSLCLWEVTIVFPLNFQWRWISMWSCMFFLYLFCHQGKNNLWHLQIKSDPELSVQLFIVELLWLDVKKRLSVNSLFSIQLVFLGCYLGSLRIRLRFWFQEHQSGLILLICTSCKAAPVKLKISLHILYLALVLPLSCSSLF